MKPLWASGVGSPGDSFIDWLDPVPGQRWLDIGCGSGAFTELIVERCTPAFVQGVDPSDEQLAFACQRLPSDRVHFRKADAMALPFDDGTFDAAVFALVLYFIPVVPRGVAEVARVVRPGGSVSAYTWDVFGGGLPAEALQAEMTALGAPPPWPPSIDASRIDAKRALWTDAGLVDVQTYVIPVLRAFECFESLWSIVRTGPRIVPALASMLPGDVELLQQRLRARLPAAPDGRITYGACANAVKGVPPAEAIRLLFSGCPPRTRRRCGTRPPEAPSTHPSGLGSSHSCHQ